MAEQDLLATSKSAVTKHGLLDTNLVSALPNWTKINGIQVIAGRVQRLAGKRLSFSLAPSPVVSIYSDSMGGVFIQTDQVLYYYRESDLIADEVLDDVDNSNVIDDVTDQRVIAA